MQKSAANRYARCAEICYLVVNPWPYSTRGKSQHNGTVDRCQFVASLNHLLIVSIFVCVYCELLTGLTESNGY